MYNTHPAFGYIVALFFFYDTTVNVYDMLIYNARKLPQEKTIMCDASDYDTYADFWPNICKKNAFYMRNITVF